MLTRVVGGQPRGNMRTKTRYVSWIQSKVESGADGIPASESAAWRTGTKAMSGFRSYDLYLLGWT
jgi:hypothetical protein